MEEYYKSLVGKECVGIYFESKEDGLSFSTPMYHYIDEKAIIESFHNTYNIPAFSLYFTKIDKSWRYPAALIAKQFLQKDTLSKIETEYELIQLHKLL